jgi:hypothetical protein
MLDKGLSVFWGGFKIGQKVIFFNRKERFCFNRKERFCFNRKERKELRKELFFDIFSLRPLRNPSCPLRLRA